MKSKKGNIVRLIIWSILCVLSIIGATIGYLQYQKEYLQNKDELTKIVNTFNSNKTIKNYDTIGTKISGELKGKKIIITYEGGNYQKYIYFYDNNSLSTSYEINDSIGNVISMIMIDSISVINGFNEGQTYSIYSSGNLINYSFDSGLEYKVENNKSIFKINTIVPILKKDIAINYILQDDYLESDKTNVSFTKTKNNVSLIRINKNTISFKDINGITDDLIKSIENTLGFIYNDTVLNEFKKLSTGSELNTNETNTIKIEVNPIPTKEELNYFGENITFVRITIKEV